MEKGSIISKFVKLFTNLQSIFGDLSFLLVASEIILTELDRFIVKGGVLNVHILLIFFLSLCVHDPRDNMRCNGCLLGIKDICIIQKV